ncbi:hypothetical protein JCM33374_g1471 [Metschnikowia sp. JCM 33374]|nr:hypothetical protein JCM33374_g1471 [Metschnikowia sp. JCM 33374]
MITSMFVFGFVFFSASASAAAAAHGLNHPPIKRSASPLQLDFTVTHRIGNTSAEPGSMWDEARTKREAFAETLASYHDIFYLTNVYLGSQKQEVPVVIDTASADLWVPSYGYDPRLSVSAHDTGETFYLEYLGRARYGGTYFLDRFQFASNSSVVPRFKFARDNSGHFGSGNFGSGNSGRGNSGRGNSGPANSGPGAGASGVGSGRFGVLGIGATSQQASHTPYNNLPWALYAEGIIPKPSYSLFSHPEEGTGTLIFGGVDSERYSGELVKYHVTNTTEGLAVNLDHMCFNGKEFAVNAPAKFNSGVSFGLLGREIMDEMDRIFQTKVSTLNGVEYRTISCDQPSDKTIEFDFGNNTISLTYADATIRMTKGACLLGFGYHEGKHVLGNVFLKRAYVYYDLSEKSISLAQAKGPEDET